jgi:hypothetical protein
MPKSLCKHVHFHICNACEYDGFAQIMVTNIECNIIFLGAFLLCSLH